MRILYENKVGTLIFERDKKGFYRLRFGNALQWNHEDEYRYHQVLFGLPILVHPKPEEVLVLGGGDGLGVRELLKFPEVKEITLVDISEDIIFFAKKDPVWRRINQDSLNHPKVKVINDDAFNFVKRAREENQKWDVIIADYPDPIIDRPNNPVNRLFTVEHYSDIAEILKEDGIFSAQSTSVYISPNVFRKILLNLAKVFKTVIPLRVNTKNFFDTGITVSFKEERKNLTFYRNPPRGYFFDETNIGAFFFPLNDEKATLPDEIIENADITELVRYDIYELPYLRVLEQIEMKDET